MATGTGVTKATPASPRSISGRSAVYQRSISGTSRSFATVDPMYANLRHNKRLDRFTLRDRVKVNAQWQLYCLVHNIEKLAHAGYAA